MKTIKEAAESYSKHVNGSLYDAIIPGCESTIGSASEQDFESGVIFAQRWIPVEKEFPEIRDVEYQVLVKNEIYGIFDVFDIEPNYNEDMLKADLLFNDFTHWRPIERK